MAVLTRYALIGAVAAVLALGGLWQWEKRKSALLTAENASLTRSVAAMTRQAEQSAAAREVEKARAERWQTRAADLDASIEALFTGDIPDAPLDPRIIAILDGLRADD